jgi:hypothetical protein
MKRKIKYYYTQSGAERTKDDRKDEHFYYTCMYDALQHVEDHHTKAAMLRRYKAKLLLLHKRRTERTTLNIQHLAPVTEEPISMFHLVKSRKRRAATMIASIVDEEGNVHSTMHEIMKYFVKKYRVDTRKYT